MKHLLRGGSISGVRELDAHSRQPAHPASWGLRVSETLSTPGQRQVRGGLGRYRVAPLRVGRDAGRHRSRPNVVRGDKAVLVPRPPSAPTFRTRGIKAVTPEPGDKEGQRKLRGSLAGRPVGLDAADYKNRGLIGRRLCDVNRWRNLASRFD